MRTKKGRGFEKVQVDESTTTRVGAIRKGRACSVTFTAFLLFFCMPIPAPVGAADVYWDGDADDQWSVQENWDSNSVPVAWDRVFIVDGSGVGFDYDYSTTDRLEYLEIDNESALWLDDDAQTLSVGLGPGSDGGGLTVGNTGSGILDHFGGNVYLNATYEALILGNEEGSTGRYNLYNGTLTVVGYQELIGNRGTGQFYQEGGLHEFGGGLYIGSGEWGSTSNSAYGLYVMNDGELRAIDGNGGIVLGEWGSRGDFLHYYGTVEIGELTLGRQVGGVGYYVQSAGSLTVSGWERIGNTGTGEFTQNGGNHTVEDLTIGNADWYDPEPSVEGYYAGAGTYRMEDLSSGASLQVLNDLVLGDGGTGSFIHTDGSVKVDNDLKLGREFESFTGHGEYELHNGTLEVAGSTIIGGQEGYGGTGWGAFSQDGGTNRTGWLFIGDTEGGEGSYTLEGGELVVYNNDMVGMRGAGTFTQTGGIHRSTGGFAEPNYQGETIGLVVGNSMTSQGTYNLDSGELDVSYITVVGYEGAGTFNLGHEDPDTQELIGDGIHGTSALYVGFKPHSYGEYHLYAGSLSVLGWPGIVVGGKDYNDGGGEGVFNQYGGTVNTTNLWLADSPSSLGTYNLFDGELTSGTYNVIGVRGSGTFNQYGGTYTVVGDLNIAGSAGSSGTYNFLGGSLSADRVVVNEGGIFRGTGTVTAGSFQVNGGSLLPGASPGVLTIQGSYSQSDAGLLEIELGAWGYDVLNITGTADLAGTLQVLLYDGYVPVAGSYYDILTASAISGGFGYTDLPSGWAWSLAYLDLDDNGLNDTVRLSANAVPIPASVWIFGSGLLGLLGFRARTRKNT